MRMCQQLPPLPLKLPFCGDYQPHSHLSCTAGMSVSPMSPSGLPGSPGPTMDGPRAAEQPGAAVSWLSPLQPHPALQVRSRSALGLPCGDVTGTCGSFLQ